MSPLHQHDIDGLVETVYSITDSAGETSKALARGNPEDAKASAARTEGQLRSFALTLREVLKKA